MNLDHFLTSWSHSQLVLEKLLKLGRITTEAAHLLSNSLWKFVSWVKYPPKRRCPSVHLKSSYSHLSASVRQRPDRQGLFPTLTPSVALQCFQTFWCYLYPLWKKAGCHQALLPRPEEEAEGVNGKTPMGTPPLWQGILPQALRLNEALHLYHLLWVNLPGGSFTSLEQAEHQL